MKHDDSRVISSRYLHYTIGSQRLWQYIVQSIAFIGQLYVFYIAPLFAYSWQMSGVLILCIIVTVLCALLYGYASYGNKRWWYPVVVSLMFIPTIYLYFDANISAYVYVPIFAVCATASMAVGGVLRAIVRRIRR